MTGNGRRRRLTALLAAITACAAIGLWADWRWPPDLRRLHDTSPRLLDRHGELLHTGLNGEDRWQLPARVATVDPKLVAMIVAFEDRRFWRHPGVDPLALGRAAAQWARHGRVVSGGSTLSMQTARLLHDTPHTVGGKLRQALRAVQLEWHYSKTEILSMYLTLAPYGGNLHGVEAASRAWFGRPAAHLSDDQAALLAVLPQAPERYRPDRHPDAAQAARAKLVRRVAAQLGWDAGRVDAAIAGALPRTLTPLPQQAYHAARRLAGAPAPEGAHHTAIDAAWQRQVSAMARAFATGIDRHEAIAVLVADNASGAIRVYLGHHDLGGPQGHVDMIQARRSPASTLKPFIYGLAFEDGIAVPGTRLRDGPHRFGDYAPANFDRRYRGDVTLAQALQQSLNVPAVALLEAIGPRRFAHRLAQAGAPLALPADATPNLAMALGGAGTTLWDLVHLYRGLGRAGQVTPLHLGAASAAATPRRLLSPEATGAVVHTLLGTPPPAGLAPADRPFLAFKTGTAYGYRDTWAIGTTDALTLGVWIGRPDGRPGTPAVASERAAVLLWQIAAVLGPQRPPPHTHDPSAAPARGLAVFAPALDRADTALRIAFPRDGSTLEATDCTAPALPVAVEGGQRPYHLLVNGAPTARFLQRTGWQAPGSGRYRLTVTDATGARAHSALWVASAPCDATAH